MFGFVIKSISDNIRVTETTISANITAVVVPFGFDALFTSCFSSFQIIFVVTLLQTELLYLKAFFYPQ